MISHPLLQMVRVHSTTEAAFQEAESIMNVSYQPPNGVRLMAQCLPGWKEKSNLLGSFRKAEAAAVMQSNKQALILLSPKQSLMGREAITEGGGGRVGCQSSAAAQPSCAIWTVPSFCALC